MIEFDLSYLPTEIPSRVRACSLYRISVLYVSWLKYYMENNWNHVLEFGLVLWTNSKGVVSFKPKRPRTWLIIIYAWWNVKYQNSLTTWFYVMYALVICIRVRHVRSDNPFRYWRPSGAAIMFDLLERIQHSAFPPISFLLKLEWKRLGNCPASDLKFSSAEVMDVEDKYDTPYNHQHLVST